MTKSDKAILFAMVLGDGHVRAQQAQLVIKHCAAQRPYLEHKANELHRILGGACPRVVDIDNSGHPGCYVAKSDPYFRILRNRLYRSGVKQKALPTVLDKLTKDAFSYWWADDGSLTPRINKKTGRVKAWLGFLSCSTASAEEAKRVASRVNELFGVEPLVRKNNDTYRLEFNTTKLRMFLPQLTAMPSVEYKFIMDTSAGHRANTR